MKNNIVAILLFLAGGLLSGCGATMQNIQVNGYTDPATPVVLTPGATIFVIENQKAQNPLLEKEIAGKINKLLSQQGYPLAPYDQAQYYLFFGYGIGKESNLEVAMPDVSYGFGIGGGSGSYWRGGGPYFWGGPFFTFYPPPDPVYDRWLLLNVVDGKYYREKGEFRTVWVGEARSTGTSGDLRSTVDYLLLADFQQFGRNTGKAIGVQINQEAPQVQGLRK